MPSASPTFLATRAAEPSTTPTITATPTPAATPSPVSTGLVIHGLVFLDHDGDGVAQEHEPGVAEVEVRIQREGAVAAEAVLAVSEGSGSFQMDGLALGTYLVEVVPPEAHVASVAAGGEEGRTEVVLAPGRDGPVHFGIRPGSRGDEVGDGAAPETLEKSLAGLPSSPLSTPTPQAVEGNGESEEASHARDEAAEASVREGLTDDGEVIMAFQAGGLPLQFAPGRSTLAQVDWREVPGGLWLGVPFRSQMDGGFFQYVNCGPASLSMIFGAFGLDIAPSEVRGYLNWLLDAYDPEQGTSLDVLSRIAQETGITPLDLNSERGGYREWSIEALRWHISNNHPVITLAKYRYLPGHTGSSTEFDHYIVITGMTDDGFIYHDGAFATTLGYGLEISAAQLEYAWDQSSIPRHAVAFAVAEDLSGLSFPERPRQRTEVATAELLRTLRETGALPTFGRDRFGDMLRAEIVPADQMAPVVSSALTKSVPGGELVESAPEPADSSAAEESVEKSPPLGVPEVRVTDDGQTDARVIAPQLFLLLGGFWLLATVWSVSGALVHGAQQLRVRARVLTAGFVSLLRG